MRRLVRLAEEINDGETLVLEQLGNCVESLIESAKQKALVGQRLIESKSLLTRGHWMSWLERHCPNITHRTANNYMTFARAWPELTKRLDAVANWKALSNLERLQRVRGLLAAVATGDSEDQVQPALPDVVKASELMRWAGWLEARVSRIKVNDLVGEERQRLRAKLEPAASLYEQLAS